MRILVMTLFCGLCFGVAHAQTRSFDDSKPIYQNLKSQYDTDENSIRQIANGKIAAIDQQIQTLQGELQNCTDFDCRKQKTNTINSLEADKKDLNTKADVEVMEKAKVFLKKAQEIAVDAFVFETLRIAVADSQYEHFADKGTTGCGQADFLDYSISPSRAMTCKQINVEFKHGPKFYKMSTAVGLQYAGNDHSGNSQGIITDREVNTINSVFGLTTTEFMEGAGPGNLFGGKFSSRRPEWSQVIFDYYGGSARYYTMYNPYWVGHYTVSVESY